MKIRVFRVTTTENLLNIPPPYNKDWNYQYQYLIGKYLKYSPPPRG